MEGEYIIDGKIRGRVEPNIYAFRTTSFPYYTKVGDTYRPVSIRLEEWSREYENLRKIFEGSALVNKDVYFRDYAVHRYLQDNNYEHLEREQVRPGLHYSDEFYKDVDEEDIKRAIDEIKDKYGNPLSPYIYYSTEYRLPEAPFEYPRDAEWEPRKNQQTVIDNFMEAYNKGRNNLLLYAVMRFGKTFTALCCAKEMKAKLVVVVSGKTAVKEEWKENVQRPKIFGGFKFVSVDDLRINPNKVSEELNSPENSTVVVFLTLQDLLGQNIKAKHADLFKHNDAGEIDLLIIDESHFAARSEQTGKVLAGNVKIAKNEDKGNDEDIEQLSATVKVFNPKIKLHLSGTPYRILMTNEFQEEDIIAKVQYNDIYEAQQDWYKKNIDLEEWKNPYFGFPQMIRFAFNLNNSARAELANLSKEGVVYNLNELFCTRSLAQDSQSNKHKEFIHYAEVLDLLKAIDGSKHDENIFSFLDYKKIQEGEMCHHIVMVLPWRASCDAMEVMLKKEKFKHLSDYKIVNISGFGCPRDFSNDNYTANVKRFISENEQKNKHTITLTVGKMLTGSTVKEWDTMIYLKETSSPQEYDQAIYRLQSQYLKKIKTEQETDKGQEVIVRDMKPQTLLVDFDPTRMFKMQSERTFISNAINEKKGNDELSDQLGRDLEISPIICVNKDKIEQVTPQNIIDAVREYSKERSVLDETFDIYVDGNLFDDTQLKSLIDEQPEMNRQGSVFSMKPNEGEGTDIDTKDSKHNEPTENPDDKEEETPSEKEEEIKALTKKLQTYYFKILLFAYLSDLEEKSLADVITNIENNEECRRIAKNIELDLEGLKLIHDKIHYWYLASLDNKINNIDTLGGDTEADIQTALKKFSRLSSNIITTPENIADEMISILPDDVTSNSRFLNIAGKIGEFEYAICKRYGAKVKKNIYTIPINGVTYECTRKMFKMLGIPTENILYNKTYSFDLIDENKNDKIIQKLQDMKIDVIVGNPPYQVNVGVTKENYGVMIFDKFVRTSKEVTQNYVSMIMPSRWFTGGRGLDSFRDEMLNDRRISLIKDFVDSKECFPGVDIAGGACYILWDKNHNNDCTFISRVGGKETKTSRKLNEFDLFPRYIEALSIIRKVTKLGEKTFASTVGSQTAFGFITTFRSTTKHFKNAIALYTSGGVNYVKREEVRRAKEWIDLYKVIFSTATAEHAGTPDKSGKYRVLSSLRILNPQEICSQSYFVGNVFKTLDEATNCITYLKTRFVRFLLQQLVTGQHLSADKFRFVPLQDFSKSWTDEELYAKYGLTDEEIAFIESMIKPME